VAERGDEIRERFGLAATGSVWVSFSRRFAERVPVQSVFGQPGTTSTDPAADSVLRPAADVAASDFATTRDRYRQPRQLPLDARRHAVLLCRAGSSSQSVPRCGLRCRERDHLPLALHPGYGCRPCAAATADAAQRRTCRFIPVPPGAVARCDYRTASAASYTGTSPSWLKSGAIFLCRPSHIRIPSQHFLVCNVSFARTSLLHLTCTESPESMLRVLCVVVLLRCDYLHGHSSLHRLVEKLINRVFTSADYSLSSRTDQPSFRCDEAERVGSR
jgi:hypothetical protein